MGCDIWGQWVYIYRKRPAVCSRLALERMPEARRVVHELLWDASNVDARAAQTPRAPRRRWAHVVTEADAGAERRGLLGARDAARASADDEEVVVEAWC